MCFFDPQSKALASVGTVLEITQHTRLDDGRLLVSSIGAQGLLTCLLCGRPAGRVARHRAGWEPGGRVAAALAHRLLWRHDLSPHPPAPVPIGRERFRIRDVIEERPVLVCDVEPLPEDEDTSEKVRLPFLPVGLLACLLVATCLPVVISACLLPPPVFAASAAATAATCLRLGQRSGI
jgi:hypothetical protein